ncbi:fatty acid desaturase-domain-containing protein [Fusarium oxysporum Fo47]|uniref:Omega-6 fatty acid desaturase (Delta-12 desaturase) n=1 Tax=Fusarium oxysporum Fo47 TaxID=660027 RepID=W9KNU6_FUSOX|nr:fatty acid desaturase-domain-containing protein [Fusarium oxysporum Fo47]EWZ46122.1 omega-6 fatty acid desaturase (delta-12 desaturase) [Fusarium oxysporum Fo47]QKD52132.1 fatty acid desaturase-domain-containing protein [Fusarium oxysporum Fo47]
MASVSTSTVPGQHPAFRHTVTDFESSTSLSSLSSVDANRAKPTYDRLLDTYGNEFTPPDFTIKDIRDAILKHCFERFTFKGYIYILRDIICLVTTFTIFYNFVTPGYFPSTPGIFGTGLWVIAHECGYQAFSESRLVNDATGWVLHSALLVLYFSWKISYGKHHKATGNMERDMVFVPRTREQHATCIGRIAYELSELTEETPAYTLLRLVMKQLVGWPSYILTNVTGHNYHECQGEGRGKGKKNGLGGGVNHFDPRSPIYEAKQAKLIILSDIGIGIAIAALVYLSNTFGWTNMLVWYGIPYLWVNHWLVAITFLQHTDPTLPHYTADEWNFVRGAAATIDRDMGFIGRHLLHGIIETHVLHHYVSTIPFYNADEASKAIRPVMGDHYRTDTKDGAWGFIRALWISARMCQWVEPSAEAEGASKGILFFRNHNGLGTKPVVLRKPE